MAAIVYRSLTCDAPRCGDRWIALVSAWTASELRLYVWKRGWRHTRDGRDLCPDHAGQPPANTTQEQP